MAETDFPVNHPLSNKRWAKELAYEALKETYFGRFIGTSSNSLIQMKTEVSKDAGDKITIGLRMQLTGTGVAGDETMEGNEEALALYNDSILIDQTRNAVKSKGRMSEQRVPFSFREEARDGLSDWFANKYDTWFFNQICGNTGATDLINTGHNATTAPTTTTGNTRWLIPTTSGSHAAEASLSTTDTFQLAWIDRAVNAAKVASPILRPIRYKGGQYFVMFLHPHQVTSLRTDATANRITWYDAQKALVNGGDGESNGIFSGALGMYNGVILHEAQRIPTAVTGANAANVRRAVLCGAQSAFIAFGQGNGPSRMRWNEKLHDYDNKLGVQAAAICGIKKAVFNSIDFGTVVVSTYAASPN